MKKSCNLKTIQKGNWIKFRNGKRAVVEHVNRFHATGLVDLYCRETNVTLHYQMTGAHFNDPEWDVCEINHTSPKVFTVTHWSDEAEQTELIGVYIDRMPSADQMLQLIFESHPKFSHRSPAEHDRMRENLKRILVEGVIEFDVQNDVYYVQEMEAKIGVGHHFQYFNETI